MRIDEYEEGDRPFEQDTIQLISSFKEEHEELLKQLQELEEEDKKPTPIPLVGQFEESPK